MGGGSKVFVSMADVVAFYGAGSVEYLGDFLEEALPISDGHIVTVVEGDDDEAELIIDTIGHSFTFPITLDELLDVAQDMDEDLAYVQDNFVVWRGDPRSTVVIHVPHASQQIPPEIRESIVLDDDALHRELDAMTDAFTDVIASRVATQAGVRPWVFVNRLSRLVVDPERFPDEREEMNAVGMGAVYTRTSTGEVLRDPSEDDTDELVAEFFDPLAEELSSLVDRRLHDVGTVTIIDLHSFPLLPLPYELHDGPRPEICLGTDAFHTPGDLVELAQGAFSDFEVGTDSPFSGCYVPLAHHESNHDVHALMVELRRDLYLDESFQLVDPALGPIVGALAALVDAVAGPVFTDHLQRAEGDA